jgi:hypothetical protein
MSDEPRDPLADLLRTPVPTGRRTRSDARTPPTDRPPSGPPAQWIVLAGMALGILAVIGGYLVASGDDTTDDTAAPTTTTTTITAGDGRQFPDGYTPVTDLVAIHADAIVPTPDRVMVGFTTAVLRGFDPELSTPFQGGDFTLVYSGGTTQTAEQIIFDSRAPGAFSVAFPAPPAGAGQPSEIVLTSTWTRRPMSTAVSLDAESVPYVLPEPLQIGFDDGSSVTIETLTFDETGGEGTWAVPPGDGGAGSVTVSITVERPDAQPWYLFSGETFDLLQQVIPASAASSGTFLLDAHLQGGDPDVTVVADATLEVFVDLVESMPAQLSIDLAGVPIVGP